MSVDVRSRKKRRPSLPLSPKPERRVHCAGDGVCARNYRNRRSPIAVRAARAPGEVCALFAPSDGRERKRPPLGERAHAHSKRPPSCCRQNVTACDTLARNDSTHDNRERRHTAHTKAQHPHHDGLRRWLLAGGLGRCRRRLLKESLDVHLVCRVFF
jgi:hypothetical protein